MEESILVSIKSMLGAMDWDDEFDDDIIMHINTTFMVLHQMGVGPDDGFTITGDGETWSDYIGTSNLDLHAVKTYIYLKAKLMFDPPQSGTLQQTMTNLISELEWRLNVSVDPST